MQWIVDFWPTPTSPAPESTHFEDFEASREIAIAYAGSLMANLALAGTKTRLDEASDGRIVIVPIASTVIEGTPTEPPPEDPTPPSDPTS